VGGFQRNRDAQNLVLGLVAWAKGLK
jgi:hypothetical protein